MNTMENDDMKFWIEDGILYNENKKTIIVTPEKAKEIIALRHKISNNEKQYWCFSFYNIKNYTKEARDYAEKYGQEFLYASAAVVNSYLTMFIFNVFNKWHNPKIPFRAFKNKADAVKWLKELKRQNEK